MTVIYVTKYALSSGAYSVEAEVKPDGHMAVATPRNGFMMCFHGKDFWLTEAEALEDCERRREDKLKSLERQRSKLEKMKFKIKDAE